MAPKVPRENLARIVRLAKRWRATSSSGPWAPIAAPLLTRAQQKLIDAAVFIEHHDPESAFLPRDLVQCTLPHSDPGDVPQWVGYSHNVTVGIQPGRDLTRNASTGIPYGSVPRLILYWMTTEVKRTGSRELVLGQSLATFMRALGLDPTSGGKKSDAYRLREQMRRLCRCSIEIQQTSDRGEYAGSMKITDQSWLAWNARDPEQAGLWESRLELSQPFFDLLFGSVVPVDLHALRALKKSPLALDLYAWATYTTHLIGPAGKPREIPWRSLWRQFGAEYKQVRDFKQHALHALQKVKVVYPALNYKVEQGCLKVYPGRPAIAPVEKPQS